MCAKSTKDDTDLWAEVIKSVTPAKRDDVLFKPTKASKKIPQTAKPKKAQALVKPALQTSIKPETATQIRPADLRSARPVMRAGIDNASARRLTKGAFEIDDTLDLHGKTEAAAHKVLLHFVQSASRRGLRTLLIITGKGARGEGILRKKVPEWLKDYPLKPHILAISQASPKDGGGGALYVRLRRNRDQ